jgi:hypothetical protein
MGAIKIGWANDERRSTWEPPVVTKVAIGAETKSATPREASLGLAEPSPPSPPATKFGFSFEMAFPLSARTEK